VKIASLSSQLLVESSPLAEQTELEKAARAASSEIGEVSLEALGDEAGSGGGSGGSGGSGNEQETREGLKRLSDFLKKAKRKSAGKSTAHEVALDLKERRRMEAFERYIMVQNSTDSRDNHGVQVNKVA
jgi:hypothetical protein